jgi:DNA-binding NarL/FixJ family response regulator
VQRPIIAAVDDMFFVAKIRATAQALDVDVRFSRNQQSTIESAREVNPSLVIVDLQAQKFDPFALAASLKADAQLDAFKLLGFFSHVQTALMRQAKDAGFDYVLPRSAFSQRLAEILQGKLNGVVEG